MTIAQNGQTISRNFNGSWIRTASLTGMVSVEGVGLPGVTVSISGRQDAQMQTDGQGQYTFTGLRAGNYTIEISGFDPTDVAFSSESNTATVAVGATKVVPFEGVYVRESTISGQVSVEGSGLSGVTVSLQGMGSDVAQMTDAGGQYTFSELRAGEYQVAISGYDTREYGFSTTSATVQVAHGRTENVPFEGMLLRTGSIMGQVSIEGEGLADVTVSLSGEGENQSTMTDNSGQYTFSDLPAGNFSVGISGYDTDDYSFETTSKNVSLALGATATVPFEGILLRTSGLSGRVSVEGMGLGDVMVAVSGGDLEEDMTTTTDATGQYAIAGLAEGDYTVSISGFDDVSYVFENTSMDVTLGDDDVQIVNFMGMHARTASISGKVYVDEAGKNDAYDDGEDALMAPGIALALVGPGILDRTIGATGADGSFSFGELRAGPYQLVVANADAAGPDYAYGGPSEGYGFNLGVGDEETQDIPFDVTHTTVNFSVNLKAGAAIGAALPGATVSFFSDMAGAQMIGDAMTDDGGMASMRIARSMANNHTVYARVAAPANNYSTDGAMQAVMWDAKYTMHAASNSSDITNTMADFSFSGKTIATDFSEGMALGGWAISVTSGGDAVEGAPTALGADGSASFSETAAAGKTYKVSVAANQDDALDGGEKYEGTSVEYTHTGLALPATMPAGEMEVNFTTQTLKVYVHNERDQVHGFTGNVLGGDARASGVLDIGIRKIERGTGRSRAFQSTDGVKSSNKDGVYTFRNVPANAQVIVQADVMAGQNVRLLGEDELDAYTGHADNGMTGGAFGDNGGSSHTVELCPLMSRTEDQRHGACGTFAFVNTYAVHGQVWEYTVATDGGAGGFRAPAKTAYKGVVVSMNPVDGENLAGDSERYTSGTDNKATRNFNEAMFFDWGRKAAGEYTHSVSSNWVAKVGTPDAAVAFGDELSPLGADLQIDVSPTTGYVYGTVTDSKGFRVEGATVTANTGSGTTDAYGRYRIRGFSGATVAKQPNKVAMTVTMAGFAQRTATIDFAANAPAMQDFELSGEATSATVSGTVRSGGNPVAGVTITINGGRPLGATKDLKTGNDGTYTALVPVGEVMIAPAKAGMSFFPESHRVTTTNGGAVSGLDFTGYPHGTITGRVLTEAGGPMSGVTVTATPAAGGDAADEDVTDVRGVYSLSVPFGRYNVTASADGYTFATEAGASVSVNVASGGTASVEDFSSTRVQGSAAALSALSLGDAVSLSEDFDAATFAYTALAAHNVTSVTVTATAGDNATVSIAATGDADDASTANGRSVDLAVGPTTITVTVTSEDGSATQDYTVAVTREHAVVTLSAPATIDEGGDATITATVNYAQAEEFTVTVDASGGSVPSDANTLTFAADATTSTGSVTVTAANNDTRNADDTKVTVSGSTDAAGVTTIADVEMAVIDDELVATAPRNLQVTLDETTDGTATVTWDHPAQAGSAPISSFVWEATAFGSTTQAGTVDLAANAAAALEAPLTSLDLGVEYTFTVHAVSSLGEGDAATTAVEAMPGITMVLDNTTGLTEDGTTTTATVTLTLTAASAKDVTITVSTSDTDIATVANATVTIPASQTAVPDGVSAPVVSAVGNVTDDGGTPVSFDVSATSDDARDPDDQSVTITDDDDVPGPPGALVFSGVSATGFTVEWTSPTTPGTSAITSYEIRYSSDALDADDEWVTVTGDGGARTHAITGLTANTAYNVEVRAVSAAGNGTAVTGTGTTSAS